MTKSGCTLSARRYEYTYYYAYGIRARIPFPPHQHDVCTLMNYGSGVRVDVTRGARPSEVSRTAAGLRVLRWRKSKVCNITEITTHSGKLFFRKQTITTDALTVYADTLHYADGVKKNCRKRAFFFMLPYGRGSGWGVGLWTSVRASAK